MHRSTILPSGSSHIHPPGDEGGALPVTTPVRTIWIVATTGRTRGRQRLAGTIQAQSAPKRGSRTRAYSMRLLLLEGLQTGGVDGRKLPADVVDDNSHDKYPHQKIEQCPRLYHERHRLTQQQSEHEDPVFHHQVADDL